MRRDLCWMDEIKMHGTTLKSKLGYKLEVLGLCVCMCVCSLISFMLSTLAFIIINIFKCLIKHKHTSQTKWELKKRVKYKENV